jgi:mRNA interferase RelE/StbE
LYRLLFLPAADRELSRLLKRMPAGEADALGKAIEDLQDQPRPPHVRRLSGPDAYRLRVGHYRIIYEIDDDSRAVTVVRIARRSERTYRF